MRTREEIRELVIAIDKKYPEFAELCFKYKWDNAIDSFKLSHPEVTTWEVDSIGDPVNRKQAHDMFVSLCKGKRELKTPKAKKQVSVWDSFYLFVDLWKLEYVQRGGRPCSKADLYAAVKEYTTDKSAWSQEQVTALQDRITQHTAEYVKHTDPKYLCSAPNYFAKEQWTGKIIKEKASNAEVSSGMVNKNAGAPTEFNQPTVTVIKMN